MSEYKNHGTEWKENEIKSLVDLWHRGKPASYIALQLNEWYHTGRSQNSVIGKIHRLMANDKTIKHRPNPIKYARTTVQNVREVFIDPLKHDKYCNEPNCFGLKTRSNYCDYHANLYYEPKKAQK